MVSCLIFRSSNHFEFIFLYGVRECSNFIDLHAAVQLSQHHLLKRLSFLRIQSCLLCHKLIDHGYVGLLLGSLFYSTDLYVCFCASTMLFGTAHIIFKRIFNVDGIILILQKRKLSLQKSLIQLSDKVMIQICVHCHHATVPPLRAPTPLSYFHFPEQPLPSRPFAQNHPFSPETLSLTLLSLLLLIA